MAMRRIVCRAAMSMTCAFLLVGPAFATDLPLPVKSPRIVPPAPIYDWSGFYLGVHAGYGWDPATATFDPIAYGTATAQLGVNVTAATAPFSLSVNPDGWLGGLQAGYNWQAGALVYGLEADVSWSRIKDDTARPFSVTASSDGDDPSFTGSVRLKQELDYFGTVRGRVGLASNTLLLFATGGLSWGHVKTTFETFGLVNAANSPLTSLSATSDKMRFGFSLGGGAEWAFVPTWSVKAEYLYIDLGKGDTLTLPGGVAVSDFHMHLVRAGLNHSFSAH